MLSVRILALEDCTPIAMVGAMEIFNKANLIARQFQGKAEDLFEVQMVGKENHTVATTNGYPIHCHCLMREVTPENTDLVIIPAIEMDIDSKLALNADYIPWLQRLHGGGVELASICTGAFLLAKTGLLNGKSATTHWMVEQTFRQMFPEVRLMPEKVVIDESGIYCSGGATSFLNFVLYLVEKFGGAELAVYTSKMLLIDRDKSPQNGYAIFLPQKSHSDEVIWQAQQLIETRATERINVEALSGELNMSRRNFIRRFKKATGNTPIEYIQRVKVERAKKAFETGESSVQEIMFEVGYEDLGAFRKLFQRCTGLSPAAYRAKYRHGLSPTV